MVHAPAGERGGDRDEVAPGVGQLQLHAGGQLAEASARGQPQGDHLLQMVIEHPGADSRQARDELADPRRPGRERQHDQQGPAVSGGDQRASERRPLAMAGHTRYASGGLSSPTSFLSVHADESI